MRELIYSDESTLPRKIKNKKQKNSRTADDKK